MPIYAYLCRRNHAFERYLPLADYAAAQTCECGAASTKQLCAPLVVADLPGYQSPVDGRWVEGRKARREDLARNNCVPYEPSMKAEHAKRIERSNAAIDRKVDEHVEAEISRMPARKREKLEAEIRGKDLAFTRSTVTP
jgi:predicted nucleic acid-binding Zn ribbon protein